MATNTTNYNMVKPGIDDDALIADLNGNTDIIDAEMRAIRDNIAIVVNGNTAPRAISAGQYLFIKNHSSLSAGGYHATANIANGATITSSNVAADADGVVNGAFSALNSKITTQVSSSVTVTPASGVTVSVAGAKSADIKYLRFTISNTSLTNAKEICTIPSEWYPVAARPYFTAINDDDGSIVGMFILNANGKLFYYGQTTNGTIVCCGLYI